MLPAAFDLVLEKFALAETFSGHPLHEQPLDVIVQTESSGTVREVVTPLLMVLAGFGSSNRKSLIRYEARGTLGIHSYRTYLRQVPPLGWVDDLNERQQSSPPLRQMYRQVFPVRLTEQLKHFLTPSPEKGRRLPWSDVSIMVFRQEVPQRERQAHLPEPWHIDPATFLPDQLEGIRQCILAMQSKRRAQRPIYHLFGIVDAVPNDEVQSLMDLGLPGKVAVGHTPTGETLLELFASLFK